MILNSLVIRIVVIGKRDKIRDLLAPQALEEAQALATRCFKSNYQDCD
jgi:hypothetical protein